MPKKKQKATPTSHPPCSVTGCTALGEHKAPRSKDALHDYVWYCLDHVREHNQKWDYFSGMDRDAIEEFMRDAITGHRPTWTREGQASKYWDALHDALDTFLESEDVARRRFKKATAHLNAKTREALALFNLDYPYDKKTLKSQYRILVKQYHPDANKGDKCFEERFKQITVLYLMLEKHLQES
jgi:hypothetical protein